MVPKCCDYQAIAGFLQCMLTHLFLSTAVPDCISISRLRNMQGSGITPGGREAKGGPHDILWNEQGPLWYRGLAQHEEAAEAANVEAILARFHVSHIVIGHTKQYPEVNARFGGKVLLTDVFAPSRCVDPHAFLIKEGDTLTTVYRGHTLALGVSGADQDAYLARVAALDKAAAAPTGAKCDLDGQPDTDVTPAAEPSASRSPS